MTTARNLFIHERDFVGDADDVLDGDNWKDELTSILDAYKNNASRSLPRIDDDEGEHDGPRGVANAISSTRSSSIGGDGDDNGEGSTTLNAIFNFTNAIIGAGAMGLGGAIAASGGLISLLCLTVFATLAKLSCDMVVELKLFLADREQTRLATLQEEDDVELTRHECPSSQRFKENDSSKINKNPDGTESSSAATQNSQNDNVAQDDNVDRIDNLQCSTVSITYEKIGSEALGLPGRLAVSLSKGLFSFGCLVAYVIVIHENFANGLEGAIYGSTEKDEQHQNVVRHFLHHHHVWITLMLCTFVILPMCLGRDISYLAKASFVSILAIVGIVFIVLYLYFTNDMEGASQHPSAWMADNVTDESATLSNYIQLHHNDRAFYDHWLRVKGGLLESLGTFVFAFVPHHTIDMTYGSLKRPLQTYKTWKMVSTTSIGIAYVLSTSLGFIVYMTFWSQTQSDLFEMYPPSAPIYAAKLCLSVSMLLTFALPFFACRDIIVDMAGLMYDHYRQRQIDNLPSSLTEALLPVERERLLVSREPFWLISSSVSSADLSASEGVPANETQRSESASSSSQPNLRMRYHIGLTLMLWSITVILALAAPNLGDVLDLVGAISGSMIGFVLPGLFHIRLMGLKGNIKGVGMFTCGLGICIVGTFFSSAQLVIDVFFTR